MNMLHEKQKQSVNPFVKKRVNSFFVKNKEKLKSGVNVNRILADYQKSRRSKANPRPASVASTFDFPFESTKLSPENARSFKIVKKKSFANLIDSMLPAFSFAICLSIAGIFHFGFFLFIIAGFINLAALINVLYRYCAKSNSEKVWLNSISSTSSPSSYMPNIALQMSKSSSYSPSTPIEIKEKIDSLINSVIELNVKDLLLGDYRYLKATFELDLPQLYASINWDTLKDNEQIKLEMLSVLSSIEDRVDYIVSDQKSLVSKNIQIQLNYLKKKSNL